MVKEAAPISATTTVQRGSTPARGATSAPALSHAAKPIGATRNGPTAPVAMVKLAIPMRPPGVGDLGEAHRAVAHSLRTVEQGPDRRGKREERKACEQREERREAALHLRVVRPGRPVVIQCEVVRRLRTVQEPGESREHREGEADRAPTDCHEVDASAKPADVECESCTTNSLDEGFPRGGGRSPFPAGRSNDRLRGRHGR